MVAYHAFCGCHWRIDGLLLSSSSGKSSEPAYTNSSWYRQLVDQQENGKGRNHLKKPSSFRFLTGAAVAAALLAGSFSPAFGIHTTLTQAAAADHFKAIGPDRYQGGDDAMRTPQDYENAAVAQPNSLFSLCRKAPFNMATKGSTSIYAPFTAANVDTIVNDTLITYVDGSQCGTPENEQNITVNPKYPSNVVTASNDYRYNFEWPYVYVSNDGGKTFNDVQLNGWDNQTGGQGNFKQFDSAGGDPVLAYAPDGKTLYYAALVYSFAYSNRTPSGVAVAASHDGGQTWGAPSMVTYDGGSNFFNDKEWITVGADGAVHVSWTLFNQGAHGAGYISSPIEMSTSTNGGATWSAAVQVSDAAHPYNQGSSSVVAPNGTIYVAYEGATPSSGYNADATLIATSTDGGQTFTNNEIGRVYDDYNCYATQAPGAQDRQTLSGEQFRLNSFPSLAVDPTSSKLAVAWADDRANASCGYEKGGSFTGLTQSEVQLSTSTVGTNWTSSQSITPGSDTIFPAVGANAGRIVVGYYTRSYSPVPSKRDHLCASANLTSSGIVYGTTPVCLDYATRSSNGNFTSETRVTTQSSNPYIQFVGAFIGDYTGIAVDSAGSAHAVWTDFRGNPGVTAPNQDTVVGNGL